jgi:predicted unusual protein kinase regulating ubiquinone biosynthesis (AarF/ABC1/UbiB family)
MAVMPKIWEQLVDCGSDIKKRKVAVKECFGELLHMVRKFEFDLPDYYLALARAMITLEGIAIAADVDFDIFQAAMPKVVRYLAAQGRLEAISFSQRAFSKLSDALCPRRKRSACLRLCDAKTFGVVCGVMGVGAMTLLNSGEFN